MLLGSPVLRLMVAFFTAPLPHQAVIVAGNGNQVGNLRQVRVGVIIIDVVDDFRFPIE